MSTEDLPILYILDASLDVTGAFVSAREDARILAPQARCVLVLPEQHRIPASELSDFWQVRTIPLLHLSRRTSALLRYLPALLRGSLALRRQMRQDGAQHLAINDFFMMHGALLRLMGYRGQIATWVRCEPRRFAGPLARPMLALAHASSNHLVTVSQFIRQLLPAHYQPTVIFNIYSGPTRARRVWGATEEKPVVYVGNYIEGKGQDMALRAFADAYAQNDTLRLHFYGSDMGLEKNRHFRAKLEADAAARNLTGSVHFHGYVPDTYPILEQAFAALNCSVSESFSRTVLEASGAGVPIIATASGGPQEILREGITGYLVPVGDASATTERLLALAQDPVLAATMGEAGAAHIRSHFHSEGLRAPLQRVLGLA